MKNEINFQELHVDKENDTVKYNDKLHKYWTKEGEQACISVTTLIHTFTTFDEDFWSSYKAIEAIVSEEMFKEIKPALLATKKFKMEYLESYNIPIEIFTKTKNDILSDWEEKRETSCVRGSNIHREHELMHLDGNTPEIKKLNLGGKFKTNISNKIKVGEKGVYPELLLSRISEDGKFRIAGQADLVIIDGNDVYILDYKTNKKIEKKSFYDRNLKRSSMMKYPLNNIQDTNFWHYTLQLSTYAWMIEKLDPNFNIKLLMLIHYDHEGGETHYECEYRKDDVLRMLGYYRKQIDHAEFLKVRQKRTF